MQEICILSSISGEQILEIRETFSGDIKLDGSTYDGCADNQGPPPVPEIEEIDPTNIESYILLSEEEVKLKNNIVLSGGVGAWGSNGKIKIENNSEISTFVSAYDLDIHSNSDNSELQKLYSPAPAPTSEIPEYLLASNLQDLKIEKNQPDTTFLDGTDYKKLEIEEGNIVFLTQEVIYLDKLDVKDGKTNKEIQILLNEGATLIIKDKFEIVKKVLFNASNDLLVNVYVTDGDAVIKEE